MYKAKNPTQLAEWGFALLLYLLLLISLTITYFHTGCSTIIGAKSFHGPVRDGKGWYQLAMVIRHNLSICCVRVLPQHTANPIQKSSAECASSFNPHQSQFISFVLSYFRTLVLHLCFLLVMICTNIHWRTLHIAHL